MWSSPVGHRGLSRALSSVVALALLTSTVIVLGAGLSAYVLNHVSSVRYAAELKDTLRREALKTVLYEEYRDRENVCVGLIRLEPGRRVYYYFVVTGTSTRERTPVSGGYEGVSVRPEKVFVLEVDYTPMSAYTTRNVLLGRLDFDPARPQPLICLSGMPRNSVLYVVVELEGNYYEVARWYL